MYIYCYRLSDGQFLRGGTTVPSFDPATENIQEYLDHQRPDIRLHRFDGNAVDKKRLATAQELTAFDAARQAVTAQTLADTDPMLLALAELMRQEINAIRAALPTPLPARTRQQIIDSFKAIYQAVLVQLNR